MDQLIRDFWDKKLVRDWCQIIYTPSIFESMYTDKNGVLKITEEYANGQKKAEEEYQKIIKCPKKIQQVVGTYYRTINQDEDQYHDCI